MPQEAQLHCDAKPVRVGTVRSYKLQVGWSECVKLLVLPQAGREGQDLNALGWRQQVLPGHCHPPVNKLSSSVKVE